MVGLLLLYNDLSDGNPFQSILLSFRQKKGFLIKKCYSIVVCEED